MRACVEHERLKLAAGYVPADLAAQCRTLLVGVTEVEADDDEPEEKAKEKE